MSSEREIPAAVATTAYGAGGDRIGTVEHFFVDDRTGVPSWVSVTTGLSGTRRSVIPAVDQGQETVSGLVQREQIVVAEGAALRAHPH